MTEKEKRKQNTGRQSENRKSDGSVGVRTLRASNRTAERQKIQERRKPAPKAVPAAEQAGVKVFRAINRTAEREKVRVSAKKKPAGKAAATQGGQEEIGRWVQIRMIPIWLRVLLFLIGVVLAAVLGVMFGFSVIGDGKAADALKPETWQHIWKMIIGDV